MIDVNVSVLLETHSELMIMESTPNSKKQIIVALFPNFFNFSKRDITFRVVNSNSFCKDARYISITGEWNDGP